MRARVRDTELYFDIDGVGLKPQGGQLVEKPVAFVIHGGPGGDHYGFKVPFAPLTDKLQLVYWDHRGQGRSARGNPESYNMENYIEDMEALRQYLGLDRIIVIGVSFGGMVALSYAVRYQQHISHLVPVVTTPSYQFIERARAIVAQRGTAEQQAAVERALAGEFVDAKDFAAFIDLMAPLYSTTWTPEQRNRPRYGSYSAEASNIWYQRYVRSYDVTEQLAGIDVPTLVIGGRHDWICAPELSELIAAKIPNADLRIFENSSHLVFIDEQQEFLDVIRGFVTYNQRA